MTVGIMAGSATYSSFLVTLRALQRFHHEGRLAEAAVFVKALTGKFSKRLAQHVAKKLCISGIVQFAGCAGLANGGLHVALRADGNELSVVYSVKGYRRNNWR